LTDKERRPQQLNCGHFAVSAAGASISVAAPPAYRRSVAQAAATQTCRARRLSPAPSELSRLLLPASVIRAQRPQRLRQRQFNCKFHGPNPVKERGLAAGKTTPDLAGQRRQRRRRNSAGGCPEVSGSGKGHDRGHAPGGRAQIK